MLRSIFFRSRPPLLREEGDYASPGDAGRLSAPTRLETIDSDALRDVRYRPIPQTCCTVLMISRPSEIAGEAISGSFIGYFPSSSSSLPAWITNTSPSSLGRNNLPSLAIGDDENAPPPPTRAR